MLWDRKSPEVSEEISEITWGSGAPRLAALGAKRPFAKKMASELWQTASSDPLVWARFMSDIAGSVRRRSLDKSGLREAFARRLEAGYQARQRVGRHPLGANAPPSPRFLRTSANAWAGPRP
jgi:hypothetical protein